MTTPSILVEPDLNKLIIYSRTGQHVQSFSAGVNQVLLPKSVELPSIVAIDADGMIVPFSYFPETNLMEALTNRSSGERVEAVAVKSGAALRGQILSLDADNVTLIVGNQINRIREYEQILVAVDSNLTRPRLLLESGGKPFTLSYLISNIAWTCVGTALIDTTNNTMHLRLAGNISNDTESDIQADIVLVSGSVYQYRRAQATYAEETTSRAMMAAPMAGQKAPVSMAEDYTKYNVGERIVRKNDIAELGTWEIPVLKLYIHQTNERDIVRFGYRFTAPDFVPGCSVNVYSIDDNKRIDAYLGSNDIEESQKGEEIDLMLGESTKLQCESTITPVSDQIVTQEVLTQSKIDATESERAIIINPPDDRKLHYIRENLRVEITNYNTTEVFLVVKHYIGSRRFLEAECKPSDKREGGFLYWYFKVPPGTRETPRKDEFDCTILTLGYY